MMEEPYVCKHVSTALKLMNADRIVMGHTIQETGKILTRCAKHGKPQIYIIDVGMSAA